MFKVIIFDANRITEVLVAGGSRLSDVLQKEGSSAVHPCGGMGRCRRCTVTVNGRQVLSCRHIINEDSKVIIPSGDEIVSPVGAGDEKSGQADGQSRDGLFFAADIGTTTVGLALCTGDGEIIGQTVFDNPQRRFGADVISRTEYCTREGGALPQKVICEKFDKETCRLLGDVQADAKVKMFAAGNTVMLHILLGKDCTGMGRAPYTPSFTKAMTVEGDTLGLSRISQVETLPCVSAFLGADIVAGLTVTHPPEKGKFNLFADLGTNAELVLTDGKHYYCTSAAAGPCFEGVNISCGMSALPGAISRYEKSGRYTVTGNVAPEGLCATGLIDLIAVLLERGTVAKSGYMDGDFEIEEELFLTPDDIRQYQLAKSAVRSGIEVLMKKAGAGAKDIDKIYVAGGFSAEMNYANAIRTGLFPAFDTDRFRSLNNACLRGLIRIASDKKDVADIIENAGYIDLSSDDMFPELFIEYMSFPDGRN